MSTISTYTEAMAGRRATEEVKEGRLVPRSSGISTMETLHTASAERSAVWLNKLQPAVVANDDIFAVLMEARRFARWGS